METRNLTVDDQGDFFVVRDSKEYNCGNLYMRGKIAEKKFIVDIYVTLSSGANNNFILGEMNVTNVRRICDLDENCNYFFAQVVIFHITSILEVFIFPDVIYLCEKVVFIINHYQPGMQIDNKKFKGTIEIVSDKFFSLVATNSERITFKSE